MSEPTTFTRMASPIGTLLLVGRDGGLAGLYVDEHEKAPGVDPAWVEDARPFVEVQRQLEEYFAGDRRTFDLELRPVGTPFQRSVWRALEEIPWGETCSYGDIARRVGRPTAFRAVGLANGRNPLSIVIPCHRVIGSGGAMTGYGWGLERKTWLLRHEGLQSLVGMV
jgi:methylated-DNA-[protein]-cysteine S-methyltransferase